MPGAIIAAMMERAAFEALVGRLEEVARRDPGGYRRRVFLLAGLGNVYLGFMVALIGLLFLLLLGSIFWLKAIGLKLALVVGAFLWLVLRALWIRQDPPEGIEITAPQAPELFAMVEALRRELRAPRFHHVLITDDFNAGVVQAPRFGIFGWPRNYLLIGLQMMKAVTPAQLKAILAHEFGHLAGGHGRMSNWIYRQRLRWNRLTDALEATESRGGFLFRPFLRWFAPYFSAYSFPLARANEYEADAASVRLTSAAAAAEALTGTEVVGAYLHARYWPGLRRRADDEPRPAFTPYRDMGGKLAQELDAADTETWIKNALARETTVDDTHPSLKDRLGAIGRPPKLELPAAGASSDRLLGAALQPLTEELDRRWQESIRPAWEERHREVQQGRRRLAELNERRAGGATLDPGEACERAELTESVTGDAEGALEQLRGLHERAPDHAPTCFMLGERLLERDDDAGIALLERAMQLDEDAILSASELVRDYHWRHGREREADAWNRRLEERENLLRVATKERNTVTLNDKFDPHGLPAARLAALVAQLKSVRGLRKAYLLRKRLKHPADQPLFVLGYKVTAWYQPHRKKRAAAVLRGIRGKAQFPGETLIVNVDGNNHRFGRKFAWIRGARIV